MTARISSSNLTGMHVGERVAAWRKAKGLTLQDLADAAGVTAPAVYQWENGLQRDGEPWQEIKPSLDKLEKVVKALGISMERFYGPIPKPKRKAS